MMPLSCAVCYYVVCARAYSCQFYSSGFLVCIYELLVTCLAVSEYGGRASASSPVGELYGLLLNARTFNHGSFLFLLWLKILAVLIRPLHVHRRNRILHFIVRGSYLMQRMARLTALTGGIFENTS